MAESLTKLAEALNNIDKSLSSPSTDLVLKLRSDEFVRTDLENFYRLLVSAVGEVGLQSWSDAQIQELCSLATAISLASQSL